MSPHTKQAINRIEAAKTFTYLISTSAGTSSNSSRSSTGASNPEVTAAQLPVASLVPPCQPTKKMKLVQKASQTVGTSSDINFKIESEVNTYIHLQITASEETPLAFWRKQEDNYPNLSILAKCYLSVSASSVPVEAMFSTCG